MACCHQSQRLCLLFLGLCVIVVVAFGEFAFGHSANVPLQCPYKVPESSPQPGTKDGGLSPKLVEEGILDDAPKSIYGQYRAALALVPCDGTALSVFTESEIPGKEYTVSVIFVYESSVDSIRRWLQ